MSISLNLPKENAIFLDLLTKQQGNIGGHDFTDPHKSVPSQSVGWVEREH